MRHFHICIYNVFVSTVSSPTLSLHISTSSGISPISNSPSNSPSSIFRSLILSPPYVRKVCDAKVYFYGFISCKLSFNSTYFLEKNRISFLWPNGNVFFSYCHLNVIFWQISSNSEILFFYQAYCWGIQLSFKFGLLQDFHFVIF